MAAFVHAALIADLLDWFHAHAADLPWRRTSAPYAIWVSEVMLQQTQVATVVGYYTRFLARFPTVQALAAAPLDDVLKAWEGLGYYSRARNLHRAAQIVVSAHGGQLPRRPEDLQKLPGVGRYTAHAVASIAFDADVAVLDGNVTRVLTRLYDIADDVRDSATRRRLWALAESLIPAGDSAVVRAGDFNQAMMELGRTVCKPRRPLCDACPVAAHCAARAAGVQAQRPVRRRPAPTPHYDVAAGVIYNGDRRILIAQRPAEGLLGGLWEFPGGKREPGESLPDALARELHEELGIRVRVGDLLLRVKHAFTHFRITLHAYECTHVGGEPVARGVADFAWVTLDEMDAYAFAAADRRVIAALRAR